MIVTFIPKNGLRGTQFENRIAPEFMNDFTDLDELYDFLLDNVGISDDKYSGPFIIPAEFYVDDYLYARDRRSDEVYYQNNGEPFIGRLAENVKMMTLLPADYDDGMTLEEAQERFKNYTYIIYTSFNHMTDGVTPKFRILILMKESVTAQQIRDRKAALHKFLGPVDRTTLYMSRGFYTPTINVDHQETFFMHINYGKPLDVMSFEVVIEEPHVPSDEEISDKDMQDVKELLHQTSVPSYERWWQMVQAMKSCGYSEYDVLDVSANNILHESPSTGVKDAAMCSSTFLNVATTVGGMGKLIILIREGGHPDFRKAKKSVKQCELEAALEKFNELKIKRKSRKSK